MDLMDSIRDYKLLEVPSGRMTHEQVGMILTLADYLGKYNEYGLEYISGVKSYNDATKHLYMMIDEIESGNDMNEGKVFIKNLLSNSLKRFNK